MRLSVAPYESDVPCSDVAETLPSSRARLRQAVALLLMMAPALPALAAEPRFPDKESLAKVDIGTLLQWLSHDRYEFREHAQCELLRRATYVLETSDALPEWVSVLHSSLGDSTLPLERRERQTKLQAEIRRADMQLLLRGTRVEMKEGNTTVRTILNAASRSIGRPVHYFGAKTTLADTTVSVKSGTFWEMIDSIRLPEEQRFGVTVSTATNVDLHVQRDPNVFTAHYGSLRARVDRERYSLSVQCEPKAHVSYALRAARHITPEGKITTVQMLQGRDSPLPPAHILGKESGTVLELDVECELTRMRRYTLDTVDKPSVIKTLSGDVLFRGLAEKPDDLGHFAAKFTIPTLRQMPTSPSLRGEDEKGEELVAGSTHQSFEEMDWMVTQKRPRKLHLYLPVVLPKERQNKEVVTFRFVVP